MSFMMANTTNSHEAPRSFCESFQRIQPDPTMTARRIHAHLIRCLLGGGLVATLACASELVVPRATPTAESAAASARRDVGETEPHFLLADSSAPRIANPVVTLWAKKGEDRRVRMYYHAAPGAVDSTTLLEFRVGDASLVAYPDGHPFAAGDSVLITISLVDAQRLIVDCEPSGLRFSAKKPATLKMSFLHTDADVNGDGAVTGADLAIESTLRIWRRESPNAPWVAQPSHVELGLHEVKSDVYGFSGYVIAY